MEQVQRLWTHGSSGSSLFQFARIDYTNHEKPEVDRDATTIRGHRRLVEQFTASGTPRH